jgi:hypothetical protein
MMTNRTIFSIALAGLAAVAILPAMAQQPAPSTTAQVQTGIACLAQRNAGTFSALLATVPYSAAERREAMRLLPLIQRCTTSTATLSVSATALRAAAAEDIYERQFTAAQAARTPPLAVAHLLRPGEARTPAEVELLAPSYALAECLSAAHSDLVRAYLAADAAGDAETAAFRALNPGLIACVPAGAPRRIGVDGPTFRGILAETLYRWSVVQRDGASAPFAAPAAPAG